MSIFSLLFGKKKTPSIASDNLAIDMNQLGIYVGNIQLTLPCNLKQLEELFGTARSVRTKVGMNYYWDNTGVMCYTRDGKTVHTLAVKVNDSELSTSEDKKMTLYRGVLTVNGMQWESVMRQGSKTEFFFRIPLGRMSAVSEYGDFMDDTVLSGVEITSDNAISDNFESIAKEYPV